MDGRLTPIGGITLRPLRASDAEVLVRLNAANNEHLWLAANKTPDEIHELIELQGRHKDASYQRDYGKHAEYVIEKTGDVVGRLTINQGSYIFHILEISLLPEYRGKGIGADVIRTCLRAAAASHVPLSLTVRMDQPGLVKLYESLGFRTEIADVPFQRMIWEPTRETMSQFS